MHNGLCGKRGVGGAFVPQKCARTEQVKQLSAALDTRLR